MTWWNGKWREGAVATIGADIVLYFYGLVKSFVRVSCDFVCATGMQDPKLRNEFLHKHYVAKIPVIHLFTAAPYGIYLIVFILRAEPTNCRKYVGHNRSRKRVRYLFNNKSIIVLLTRRMHTMIPKKLSVGGPAQYQSNFGQLFK